MSLRTSLAPVPARPGHDQRRCVVKCSGRTPWLVTLACVLTAGTGIAARQGPFPPVSLSNLQVLSKGSSPQEVIAVMRGMSQGLGVRCQYCHVGREGQPLDQFNFVADDVDKKGVARSMLQLVRTINATLAPGAAAGPVTCYTCHRGAVRPVHAPPAAQLQ